MEITFDIPHVFQPNSLPREDSAVQGYLQTCVRDLSRLSSAKVWSKPSVKQTDLTQWTFNVPAFQERSTALDNAEAMNALLRCLTAINQTYLVVRAGQVPKLYDSGVIYDRTVVWDSIPALYARRYGDCKSLTCALVAEYTVQGIPAKPVFRFLPREMSPTQGDVFHILVQTPNGFEDPSKVLGMERNENSYFGKTG